MAWWLMGLVAGLPIEAPVSAEAHATARGIVERSVAAAGGRERFMALPPVTASVVEEWGLPMHVGQPHYPAGSPVRITVDFANTKARLDLTPGGETAWGHDSQSAWAQTDGVRSYGHLHEVAVVVPSFVWFAGLPHKLLDPGVELSYVGRQAYENKDYDVVFVSFKEGVGDDELIVRFAPDSGRLVSVTYTARDLGKDVVGTVVYTEWATVGGVELPCAWRQSLVSPRSLNDVHTVTLSPWTLATDLQTDWAEVPRPSLSPGG